MNKTKKSTIEVQGAAITVLTQGNADYISLTDMLKAKDGAFFISDWLRNRNTVEFIGIWESVHNPDFNYGGFAAIRSQAGLNSYKLSVKEWVAQTNAIGLKATAGRYGGTYAHPDIAFVLGMMALPYMFKILGIMFFTNESVPTLTMLAFIFLFTSSFQSMMFAMWMDIQDNERLYKSGPGSGQDNRIF